MSKERYFIVFWEAFLLDRRQWHPYSSPIRHPTYPNRKALVSAYEGHNLGRVEITNIIELSEEDFKSWQS